MQITMDATFALVVLVGTAACLAVIRNHATRLSAGNGKTRLDLETRPTAEESDEDPEKDSPDEG